MRSKKRLALLIAAGPLSLLLALVPVYAGTNPCWANLVINQTCAANNSQICGGYISLGSHALITATFNINANTSGAGLVNQMSVSQYYNGANLDYVNWTNPYSSSTTYTGWINVVYGC
jgi:hypothetical protein